MSQVVFVLAIPPNEADDVGKILSSAPGIESTEIIRDKNSSAETGTILCRIQNDGFTEFKKYLEADQKWNPSLIIQEGTIL